ncbi:MAG: hypothetical protein EOO10_23045 [Chitinophagaceae bacterium]|nr:MAG: hypothetical protein EOO10_23045 [Chitinophagaceae bacterium]
MRILLLIFTCCICLAAGKPTIATIGTIPLPPGFKRAEQSMDSFGSWLRQVYLKPDKTVYLYNGKKKANQSAQYAVLDVAVGDKDLQQCADAVMRLRAEYFYSKKAYSKIAFHSTSGTLLDFESWRNGYRFVLSGNKLVKRLTAAPASDRSSFEKYLETVFSWAGTLSLSKELKPQKLTDLQPGDVFIKGGSPGHAVIVMDVAINTAGKKMFLLAQSYMPAQDIQLLINPSSSAFSPWYPADFDGDLVTPEWIFSKDQLAKF